MSETIDSSSFVDWMRHPVTKVIMQYLEENDALLKEQMTNPDICLANDGQKSLARIVGNREALNMIINIEYKDIQQQEEVVNVEQVDDEVT